MNGNDLKMDEKMGIVFKKIDYFTE